MDLRLIIHDSATGENYFLDTEVDAATPENIANAFKSYLENACDFEISVEVAAFIKHGTVMAMVLTTEDPYFGKFLFNVTIYTEFDKNFTPVM